MKFTCSTLFFFVWLCTGGRGGGCGGGGGDGGADIVS